MKKNRSQRKKRTATKEILRLPDLDQAKAALLLACGLRRLEVVELTFDHLQQRDEHWAIVNLFGKAGHVRTIPLPAWVKQIVDDRLTTAGISNGKLFRRVSNDQAIPGVQTAQPGCGQRSPRYRAKRLRGDHEGTHSARSNGGPLNTMA